MHVFIFIICVIVILVSGKVALWGSRSRRASGWYGAWHQPIPEDETERSEGDQAVFD